MTYARSASLPWAIRLTRCKLSSQRRRRRCRPTGTMTPPAQTGDAVPVRYLVSAYCPDREHPVGYHLRIRRDGIGAIVDGPSIGSAQSAQYDLEGLHGIMLDLLTRASR